MVDVFSGVTAVYELIDGVESFITVDEKVPLVLTAVLVDTCTRYVTAPVTVLHVSVGNNATLMALFAGNVRAGATGITGTVVNVSIIENGLVPPAFVAFTCQ